jgi:antitoxin ParD1/3/4
MTLRCTVSPQFEDFVRSQVESGRFADASEVVEAGLHLLESQELDPAIDQQALHRAVREGLDSGPDLPAEEVFEELAARYRRTKE